MTTVNLSDMEWKLMNRLWDDAPATITVLTAYFKNDTAWSKHTIITMLSRLEAKGAVRHEEGEKAKLFYPAVNRDDVRREQTKGFLSRLYNGSVGLMLNQMADSRELTEEDIAQLRAILRKAEKHD